MEFDHNYSFKKIIFLISEGGSRFELIFENNEDVYRLLTFLIYSKINLIADLIKLKLLKLT